MQSTIPAGSSPAFNSGPIVATIFGIPAVAIVLAALNDASLPVLGSGVGALLALWVLVSLMCARGIVSMRARFGAARSFLVGAPLGILALAFILSGLLGWSPLLQPIADVMAGPGALVSLDRAAIVGVGAVMLVKWGVAWLSYLPR